MRSLLAAISLGFVLLCSTNAVLASEPTDPFRFGPGPHMLSPLKSSLDYPRKRASRHASRKPHAGKLARPVAIPQTHERVARYVSETIGGRPPGCPYRAWCGCYLSKHLGLNDRSLWLARNWARIGSAASGPAPGVVVVWPHHVGLIRSVTGPGRAVVLSGNDGRAVRERERSLRGVIAYRHVGARYAALLQ